MLDAIKTTSTAEVMIEFEPELFTQLLIIKYDYRRLSRPLAR
jgi:hypothetical protein